MARQQEDEQRARAERIPEPLIRLARDIPAVSAAMRQYVNGHLTYERAIEALAIHLAEVNERMSKQIIQYERLHPKPFLIDRARLDVEQFNREYQDGPATKTINE